jgi:putative membrane protein
MSDPQAGSQPERFDVRVTADSHFAWLRTRLAIERTMMAYMRTSVSLIGFGFAIVQFLHNVHDLPGSSVARLPGAAWYLGLALIFCGVMAAIISVLEYRRLITYLWSGGYAAIAGLTREQEKKPLYAIAGVLIVIGVFAFFAVLLRFVG